MRHKSIQKKLLRYLEKDLPESEQREIQNHLQSCQICQDDLKYLETLWQINRSDGRLTAPPFLWTRISAEFRADEKHSLFDGVKSSIPRVLQSAILIGILFLTLIGGIKLGNMITLSTDDRSAVQIDDYADSFGLNYFEILPPGSIDDQVLALTESEMQK